jgi:DNA helicase IV
VCVPATLAKGLEFDAVVVVEPAEVAAAAGGGARGARLLYVALTRAVQELVVVHSPGQAHVHGLALHTGQPAA